MATFTTGATTLARHMAHGAKYGMMAAFGSGSGLDADLLDGYENTFMRKNGNAHLDMNNYNITNVNQHLTINDHWA